MRMKPLIVEVAIILTAVAGYVAKHPDAPGQGSLRPLTASAAADLPAGLAEPVSIAMPVRQKAEADGAWVVPQAAVMHIRDSDYVIVRESAHGFRRIAIQGRPLGPDRYAITGGLPRGLPVVTDSGVLFDRLAGQG
jgi:hypothetical protein